MLVQRPDGWFRVVSAFSDGIDQLTTSEIDRQHLKSVAAPFSQPEPIGASLSSFFAVASASASGFFLGSSASTSVFGVSVFIIALGCFRKRDEVPLLELLADIRGIDSRDELLVEPPDDEPCNRVTRHSLLRRERLRLANRPPKEPSGKEMSERSDCRSFAHSRQPEL